MNPNPASSKFPAPVYRKQVLSHVFSVEDLFFLVQARITSLAGSDDAGRLHTARSRNDVDLTMYRMVWREQLLNILHHALELRQTLLGIAGERRAALIPA